jgi:hypothetical protein
MYVKRLTPIVQQYAATAISAHRGASWIDAVSLLSAEASPANQLAALRFVPGMGTEAASTVVDKCTSLQRYSDAAVATAFPALCDAMRHLNRTPEPAMDILQRSMNRGAYVDAKAFGPLLRLLNATHQRKLSEVLVQWAWMSHTRAAGDPVARTAVVAALAADGQHVTAKKEEAALRRDGVLLREEGLVPLVASTPTADWVAAVSTVKFWRQEHDAAKAVAMANGLQGDDDGAPGVPAALALLELLASAQRHTQARDVLLNIVQSGGEEQLAQLSITDLNRALACVLPGTSLHSLNQADQRPGDLLKTLLLVAKAAVDAPDTSPTHETTRLLGYMGASAAILKNRAMLHDVAACAKRIGVNQEQFGMLLEALVEPLRGEAWEVGRLAVAEVSKHAGLQVPVEVMSRLMVLHQAVESNKDKVLDAFLGA